MPANFGEIANYHSRLAAQYLALAKAARQAGDQNAAEYNAELAARYMEAAQEQKTAMTQAPSRTAPGQAQRQWSPQPRAIAPKPAPKAARQSAAMPAARPSALRRGARGIFTVLKQSISGANASLQCLSLQDPPPVHAPGLRG